MAGVNVIDHCAIATGAKPLVAFLRWPKAPPEQKIQTSLHPTISRELALDIGHNIVYNV